MKYHSSEKRGFHSTFWPREMPPNLIWLYKKKTLVIFCFLFQVTLSLYLMNALVYVNIDQDIHKVKTQSYSKWKTKTTWVFFLHKHSKFWSVSLGQKVESKPLFSEEWYLGKNYTFASMHDPTQVKCRFLGPQGPGSLTRELDPGAWPGSLTREFDLGAWTGSLNRELDPGAWPGSLTAMYF